MENPLNLPVALVATQYVEDYGIGQGGSIPHFKFKGGRYFLVQTDKAATAIGVVLQNLAANGMSAGEYPTHVSFHASDTEAVDSVEDYERPSVIPVTQVA